MRSISDETDQTFNQISSLRTRARRRCRLYRLSTDVRRWPLADRFKMDDPAYGVSVADLSWKSASSGIETPDSDVIAVTPPASSARRPAKRPFRSLALCQEKIWSNNHGQAAGKGGRGYRRHHGNRFRHGEAVRR